HPSHHGHSPFFLMWELLTLACVFIVAGEIIFTTYFHPTQQQHHLLELAALGAEVILITEVALLLIIARDKISFIKSKWLTILAVLPFGGGFRIIQTFKLGWHAFEKTRLGEFLHHPLKGTKRWVHKNLGLRV
ncbi:MAG: hypothetical protein AABX02_00590, partial [archaeon]